ncbi:MAG: hypothetical protein ACFE9L_08980 [Candidatus Hodarchaeota archaeon]
MPAKFDHQLRVKRNCESLILTYQSIPNFSEWSVTISFYIALHAVNNHLAQQNVLEDYFRHPRTHKAMNEALIEINFPEEDYINYMTLYQASRVARYAPFHIFERDYIKTGRITFLIDLALKMKRKYR